MSPAIKRRFRCMHVGRHSSASTGLQAVGHRAHAVLGSKLWNAALVPGHLPALLCCCACMRRGLPGLVDCILNGVWCIFFLAIGGALASYHSLACFSFSSYW
jgi:hypothetical protein